MEQYKDRNRKHWETSDIHYWKFQPPATRNNVILQEILYTLSRVVFSNWMSRPITGLVLIKQQFKRSYLHTNDYYVLSDGSTATCFDH